MVEKGITVRIGIDGAHQNNRMDMIRDMYLTSLLYKVRTLDQKTILTETVLEMAIIMELNVLL